MKPALTLVTNRIVTREECPWLDADVPEGTKVERFTGCTYGCVGAGIAVTFEPGGPFSELPRTALSEAVQP